MRRPTTTPLNTWQMANTNGACEGNWLDDDTGGYYAQRFRCPLLFPEPTGQPCDHEQFAKGCVKDVNMEAGAHAGQPSSQQPPLQGHLHSTHQLRTHRQSSQGPGH